MDADRSGDLDKDEFKTAMASFQIGLTELEVETIFSYYDRNGDGDISCEVE